MNLGAFFRLIRRKMVRDPLPPEDVAAGWALGMFVGCSVPFGLQLVVSVPLAVVMRVSKVGATLGTFITNPVTIFFIYPAQTYVVNRLLFGGSLSYSRLSSNAISFSIVWSLFLIFSGSAVFISTQHSRGMAFAFPPPKTDTRR